MRDKRKTKAQIVEEVEALRARVAELERAAAERVRAGDMAPSGGGGAPASWDDRLRTLFELALDPCCLWDQEGRFVDSNRAAEELLGRDKEELIGKTLAASGLLPEEQIPKATSSLQSSVRGEVTGPVELTVTRRDGTAVAVEMRTFPAEMEGRPLVMGIVRDISERKRTEKALRGSEEFSSSLLEHSPDPIIVLNADTSIRYVNPALEKLTGFSLAELIGRKAPFPWWPEDAIEERSKQLEQAMEKGMTKAEKLFKKKNGESFWVETTSISVRSNGEFMYYVSNWTDITERKRAEHELGALLALHRSALDTIPSCLVVLDANLNILMVNRRYLEVYGVSASDVLGRNVTEVFPSSLLSEQFLLERIRAAAAAKAGPVGHADDWDELLGIRYTSIGYPDKYLDIRIRGIPHEEGEEGGPRVLLVMDDVTRQRLMEEEVRQAAKMESVGKLAGGVAHDFNNMLTVIKGYAELALSDAASDGLVRGYAAEIVNTASRAADLTRQLLAFGLRQTLSPRPLNLNDVVLGMEEMLGRMIGEDIEMLTKLADDLGTVEADPVQIEQVIMNLAANVRDAMPQGGKLILETSNAVLDQDYASMHVGVAPGRYVMLAVTDTGCGMDQETLEHIFEPFFTTKEVGAGSGLGLSTVYGIVKQHGGYIWAYSEVGGGTTFRVYLPRVDVETEAKTPAEPQVEQTARGSETILVVEDEAAVRSLVHLVLKRAGYGVLSASSPDEAEVLFAQRADEVALLLTDVVMPGRSGRELYEQLAAHGASLKVLYMSGYSEDAIVHRGVLRQDVEFISKPFTSDQLLKRIRGMLDK